MFSDEFIIENLIPQIIKEFNIDWNDPEHWLLHHFDEVVIFFKEKRLMSEEYVVPMWKFFDVNFVYIN